MNFLPFSILMESSPLDWIPAIAGSLLVLCLYVIVISALEGAVLNWFKWDTLPRSILAAVMVNFVSNFLCGLLLVFLQQELLIWLLVAFPLCILVEGSLLSLLQKGKTRLTWIGVLVSNQLSFLILVLPVYYFGQIR